MFLSFFKGGTLKTTTQLKISLAAVVIFVFVAAFCWRQWDAIDYTASYPQMQEDSWAGMFVLFGVAVQFALLYFIAIFRKWRKEQKELLFTSASESYFLSLEYQRRRQIGWLLEMIPAYVRAGKHPLINK